jgi:hypothetical protein
MHRLPHHAVGVDVERRAQRRVPVEQLTDRGTESGHVQPAAEPHAATDLKGFACPDLVEQPQPRLSGRRRPDPTAAVRRLDAGRGHRTGLARQRVERGERGPVEQPRRCDVDAELLAQHGNQLHSTHGVESLRHQRSRRVEPRDRSAEHPRDRRRERPFCRRVDRFAGRSLDRERPEGVAQVLVPGRESSGLAAGGAWQRPPPDQHHVVEVRAVLGGHRRPHRGGGPRHGVPVAGRGHLVDQYQPGGVPVVHLERRATAGKQQRIGSFGHHLDVGGVVVAPAQHDQLAAPAGDVQLAAVEEAEVASTQERAGGVGALGTEHLRRRPLGPPVAAGHRGTGHPDLALGPVWARQAGVGVHHQRGVRRPGVPAADHRHTATGRGRGHRAPAGHPTGDEQGRLGEPVAGLKTRPPEAGGTEPLGERVQSGGADRFGTDQRGAPRPEIEPSQLLVGHPPQTLRIAKVRRDTGGGAVLADRPQPAHGPAQERGRRHQHALVPGEHRHQDAADQPHVVVGRQPAHRRDVLAGLFVEAEDLTEDRRVVQQVVVSHHHALRRTGGARRVLQERCLLPAARARGPVRGELVRQVVDGDHGQRRQSGRQSARGGPVQQHDLGARVRHDAEHSLGPVATGGRRHRHRDHPGVETAEEPGHVAGARSAHQQRPRTRPGHGGHRHRHRSGPPVELGVGHDQAVVLVVEERERGVRTRVVRPGQQHLLDALGLGHVRAPPHARDRAASTSPDSRVSTASSSCWKKKWPPGNTAMSWSPSLWPAQPAAFSTVAAGSSAPR